MRKFIVVAGVAAAFSVFSFGSIAGVAPNSGGQSMSGAKIKPASHNSDAEKSEQAPEKDDQHPAKDEKR